jgi:methionyl-tRNA formyltransferase
MRIVFMGTPDFAVTILDGLVENGLDVCGVITAADKPAGRGRQLNQSAVKQYALKKGLTVLQPTNLKDETFLAELRQINADLFVVVAFRMLPELVWSMPKKGTINLHGSLLPQYRGAAPINWALINGEKETGVTTFFIEKEIDTGKIIDFDRISITENMSAGELHDLLAEKGRETMLRTINNIENGTTQAKGQNEYESEELKKAPKIFKEDCLVDWNKKARDNHDFVRGLSPYPAAWCRLEKEGKIYTCKLFGSELTEELVKNNPAEIIPDKESFLFPCSDHYLRILDIQLEGKRRMTFKEFSSGNKIQEFKLLLERA